MYTPKNMITITCILHPELPKKLTFALAPANLFDDDLAIMRIL